jgi:hypothetical protein
MRVNNATIINLLQITFSSGKNDIVKFLIETDACPLQAQDGSSLFLFPYRPLPVSPLLRYFLTVATVILSQAMETQPSTGRPAADTFWW